MRLVAKSDILKSLLVFLALTAAKADNYVQTPPNYSFATAQPVADGDILGTVSGGDSDYYAFSVNAGDNLTVSVSSTSPLLSLTELSLYDLNGNLVAVSEGNKPDGQSSEVDFTTPAGDAGNWVIAVTNGNPGDVFDYDLSLQGATGTPLAAPNSVPEPASCSLLGGLLAGLGMRRYLKA